MGGSAGGGGGGSAGKGGAGGGGMPQLGMPFAQTPLVSNKTLGQGATQPQANPIATQGMATNTQPQVLDPAANPVATVGKPGIGQAMAPQQPQQQAPKPVSWQEMLMPNSPMNPMNKINEMMAGVVTKGADTVKGIFNGQWKDTLKNEFTNTTRDEGILGGSIANPAHQNNIFADAIITPEQAAKSTIPAAPAFGQKTSFDNGGVEGMTKGNIGTDAAKAQVGGVPPMMSSDVMQLGELSKKYEVGPHGGPGSISNAAGDKGGASYGTYQLASKAGSLNGFLKNSEYGSQFEGLAPGTRAFNDKWKTLASQDPNFGQAQHAYMEKANYSPVRATADKLGVPNTPAINQVLWSTGVQHGGGGGSSIIKKSFKPGMSEKDIINNIYDNRAAVFQRSKYYNSAPERKAIQRSVLNRFNDERDDALRMLGA